MTDIVEHVNFLCSWATDIRKSSGQSVDADKLDAIALALSEASATGRREGMEAMTDALNDDALTKRAADFLLERDQQTTQDERDEGEREASAFIILQMGAAAIRAAMER